ncbi:OLC1v1006388C2 [Oldenlandia corymbosa var. corymbosa]|uniref:OLC1v1006388C2 n=1 Tax=Oldenlandia corymbosa var. corymbosa TaxID=529605 RepID=A0AAV1DJW3_OLDCO|nr:OLC1v1006388C2 [Oldenlandia corymbosa var. corymbosa]
MAASPNWIRIKRGRRQDTFDYCIFEVPPLKKAVFKLEKTCRRPEPFGRIGEVDDDLRKRFEKSPPIAPGEHIWIGEPMKIDDDNCAVLNFDRVDDEKFSSADEYFYDHYQLVIVAKDITVALAAGLPLVKLVEDVKEAQDSNEFDNLSDMDIDSEKSFGLQDVEHHKCPDMTKAKDSSELEKGIREASIKMNQKLTAPLHTNLGTKAFMILIIWHMQLTILKTKNIWTIL